MPQNRLRRLTVLVVTPVVVVLVGVATYLLLHESTTPLYDAMQSDPMASEELPGLELEQDLRTDVTEPLGMESPAEIERSWTIADGSSRPAKLAELGHLAQEWGWRRGPEPLFCGWQKTIDDQDLCLVIRPGTVEGEVVVEISGDIGF